jgi:hypothetical protein
MRKYVYETGELVYFWPVMGGPIPAKLAGKLKPKWNWVLSRYETNVAVKLTATRGAYHKGEMLHIDAKDMVHRSALHVSNGKYYTIGNGEPDLSNVVML